MDFSMVRNMLDHVGRRSPGGDPQSRDVSVSDESSSVVTVSTQPSEISNGSDYDQKRTKPAADADVLRRAHDLHNRIDFESLAAGPGKGGPWRRVEAADRFVVFRCQDAKAAAGIEASTIEGVDNGPEVLCAGRLDACIEEVARVLRSKTEAEHNAVMTGLYDKRYIFGSLERTVSCSTGKHAGIVGKLSTGSNGEHLTVKTSSFARSALFASNEQWCYIDFFQRKSDRDGFTISQHSLERYEPTPGRIVGAQARVNQLHDLTAAYLVDLDPGSKGLRIVFNAKFLTTGQIESSTRDRSISNQSVNPGSTLNSSADRNNEIKAQTRRLLALAHGVTKIPDIVRRRRFGFQIPVDMDAIKVSNQRCPCCTRSLAPVKMSLSAAASVISTRSLSPLRMDTRRCYLCGYLVCVNCWSLDHMENAAGCVASVVVCRRCRASVDACDYSSISANEQHRGPVRVVDDPDEKSTASLLVDYLAASLDQAPVGSSERSNVFAVVRRLLHLNEALDEEDDEDDNTELCVDERDEVDAMAKVEEFLADERNFPPLESCTLGNAASRDYVIDWPDDDEEMVPRGPIPSNEAPRLSAARAAGLLDLARQLAPEHPEDRGPDVNVDVQDLELICRLAAKAIGCTNSIISVMGANHEHVLAASCPDYVGAAIPRNQTFCQHQLMSSGPIMLVHPEADVRLQAIDNIREMGLKTYVGFPVTAPMVGSDEQIAVGTLCCYANEPRVELTRSQYATLQSLAQTASQLVQQKGLQVKQRATPA